jgi:hypothetical protein
MRFDQKGSAMKLRSTVPSVTAVAGLCAVALFVVGAGMPVAAGDTQSAKDGEAEQVNPYVQATRNKGKQGEVKVYTNAELRKLYGGEIDEPAASAEPLAAAPVVSPGSEPAVAADPLQQLFDQQAQAEQRKNDTVAAEARVAEARKKVEEIKKATLATKNPLLPRPKIPEEKAEEWQAASAPDRVAMADQALAQAVADLASSEAELARLRGN